MGTQLQSSRKHTLNSDKKQGELFYNLSKVGFWNAVNPVNGRKSEKKINWRQAVIVRIF